MPSTTILLIRHGETAWNRGNVFRGTYDVPLNDTGRAQAKRLGEALRIRTVDAVYTSPLSRARETAELIVAGREIEPITEQGLTDFCYGDWTGKTDSDVAAAWPDEHHQWLTQPHRLRVPGGNTLDEVYRAAFAAMETAAARHAGQTVALVAHRVVNKLLVLGALGLGLERFPFIRQDNACLNEFEHTVDGYVICALNDTHHIRQAGIDLLTTDF